MNPTISIPQIKILTVIIEDELAASKTLNGLLKEYTPNVSVLALGRTVDEGIEAIQLHKPDLVFLDLQLRGQSGMRVLESIDTIDFEIIITTAYSQYALDSFEFGVADYLLKPITPSHLKRAVARVSERILIKQAAESKPKQVLVSIPLAEGIRYLPSDQIIRLEAARNYSWVYLNDDKPILVSKSLSYFEDQLNPLGFLRVHHSHIVNPAYIKEYQKNTNVLNLKDRSVIPVSRERRKQIMALL